MAMSLKSSNTYHINAVFGFENIYQFLFDLQNYMLQVGNQSPHFILSFRSKAVPFNPQSKVTHFCY